MIVHARDAGEALSETLESLRAQRWADWEAIVVDDGSVDGTPALLERAARRDVRIRPVRGDGAGAGAARNLGLADAFGRLVVLLDAGDRLEPWHLAHLRGRLEREPWLDAVHCGWARVAADGETLEEPLWPEEGDLFATLAHRCPFPVHACMARTHLMRGVGGFDTGLRVAEDWDLWQRVARTGARFGRVDEVLAGHVMRPDRAAGPAALADRLEVLRRGHRADPRVPDALHAGGCPRDDLADEEMGLLLWSAGRELGRGADAVPLLDVLGRDPPATLGAEWIAASLSETIDLLQAAWSRVGAFAAELEARSGEEGLAGRVARRLERAVAASGGPGARLGRVGVRAVELTAPLPDLLAEPGVELLVVTALLEGKAIGEVELPAIEGRVGAWILADAIAAEHAWPILGRYLARTVDAPEAHHDEAGWDVMLREVRPALRVEARGREAVLVVGSTPVCALRSGTRDADRLREDLILAAGFELCRAVVREGVLARSFGDGVPLRERLCAGPRPAPLRAGLIVARRAEPTVGTRPSRRAFLPAAVAVEAEEAARAAGEPVTPGGAGPVRYDPDLLWSDPARAPWEPVRAPPRAVRVPSRPDDLRWELESVSPEPDPGLGEGEYERLKRDRTLELMPPGSIGSALELGCGEGFVSKRLARRVGRLLATDISRTALARAAERCAGHENVTFAPLDLRTDELGGGWDLIVCGETLYYLDGIDELGAVARRLAAALAPGGHLLTTHANLVVDEPDEPGFAWDHPFGGARIGATLGRVRGLRPVAELRTPLYRIQLHRRDARRRLVRPAPSVRRLADSGLVPATLEPDVRWSGGAVEPDPPAIEVRILTYHRVAPDGAEATRRWRVHPDEFEDQVRLLRLAGLAGATLDDWWAAATRLRPLRRGRVVLTFDDGYADFAEHAWPILRRYGLPATLLVVSDHVGRVNAWDAGWGEEVPLLGWDALRRLAAEGVEIGSHTASHPRLTDLDWAGVAREALRSRTALAGELGRPPRVIAYPYGDADPAVRHLVGACGYAFGLGCRARPAGLHADPSDLPRIEIPGGESLEGFAARLGISERLVMRLRDRPPPGHPLRWSHRAGRG